MTALFSKPRSYAGMSTNGSAFAKDLQQRFLARHQPTTPMPTPTATAAPRAVLAMMRRAGRRGEPSDAVRRLLGGP